MTAPTWLSVVPVPTCTGTIQFGGPAAGQCRGSASGAGRHACGLNGRWNDRRSRQAVLRGARVCRRGGAAEGARARISRRYSALEACESGGFGHRRGFDPVPPANFWLEENGGAIPLAQLSGTSRARRQRAGVQIRGTGLAASPNTRQSENRCRQRSLHLCGGVISGLQQVPLAADERSRENAGNRAALRASGVCKAAGANTQGMARNRQLESFVSRPGGDRVHAGLSRAWAPDSE
jgi:hypothetical protein